MSSQPKPIAEFVQDGTIIKLVWNQSAYAFPERALGIAMVLTSIVPPRHRLEPVSHGVLASMNQRLDQQVQKYIRDGALSIQHEPTWAEFKSTVIGNYLI